MGGGPSSRCPSCWRWRNTWTRPWPSACAAAPPPTAPSGWWRPGTAWSWGGPSSTKPVAEGASSRGLIVSNRNALRPSPAELAVAPKLDHEFHQDLGDPPRVPARRLHALYWL